MPFASSGAISMGAAYTYFIGGGVASPSTTSMADYYRGGSYVPDVSQNSGIPTSGSISMGNLYGGYALRSGFSLNILPYYTPGAGGIWGYWTGDGVSIGVIGGGAQGSIDSVAFGSNPYTDGNGSSVVLNSAVYGWRPGQFTLQLSDTTDNDLKLWRVSVYGGNGVSATLYRSGASVTGTGAGGRHWSWSTSNPFQVGLLTNVFVEFIT